MTLTEMITLVRRDLKDAVTPYRWSDVELTRHINRAVKEFSERVPLPVKATIATTAASREVDISTLTNRMMVLAAEYPVDESPPAYQQFSIWGNTLTIISGDTPNGGNCYIYYGKLHTLTILTSTIPTKYEDLIATGACGYALETYADHALAELAQSSFESTVTALAKVSAQITKAETSLTDAAAVSTDIASELTSAGTEIGKASAAVATAIATGAGSIDEAIASSLSDAQTRITAAATNIASAETALGDIPARLTQAVTDLTTGDDFINKVNIGADVPGHWAKYAQQETEVALGYNRHADGHLGQAAQNLDGARHQLGAASELDKKRDANLTAASRYVSSALVYISSASELNKKRLSLLTTAQHYIATTQPFISEARRHQASSTQYISLSKAFTTRASVRLGSFRGDLKRINRTNKVRVGSFYKPEEEL